MKIVEINDKEYNMPESWEEINIEVFTQILQHSKLQEVYTSDIQYAIEMFSIILDAPLDDLKQLTRSGFDNLSQLMEWANNEIEAKDVNSWTFNNDEFQMITDFTQLTMGETISLEIMIKESNEYELLQNILPILIRRVKTITKENDKVIKKLMPFNSDEYSKLKQLFSKNIYITEVINIKNSF